MGFNYARFQEPADTPDREYPSMDSLSETATRIAEKAAAEWKAYLKGASPMFGHEELDASPDLRFTAEQWLARIIDETLIDSVGSDYFKAVERDE